MNQSEESESSPERELASGRVSSAPNPETVSEESFPDLLAKFESQRQESAVQGDGVLTGAVVSICDDGFFVDIGRKSEAFLPFESRSEETGDSKLIVGDSVNVSIAGRSPDGYLLLSRVIAERPKNWEQFELAFSTGAAIAGNVTGVTKGGLTVDIGVRAFMPASRSGIKDNSEMEKLIGADIRCRIIDLDVENENVVVDRRILLEEEKERQRKDAVARLELGAVVKGTVRSIRDFGAFVDLGGIDSLLHVRDLSWGKVSDVSTVISEGDTLEVKVLRIGDDGKRISVGRKQLTAGPWERISEDFPVGKVVEGIVRGVMQFGAFVEIADGVEGLIHVSDLTAKKRINHPSEVLKVNQKIQAVIVEVDPQKRRLKLSIKKLEPDGQDDFIREVNLGDIVTGRVIKVRHGEATIELGEGVRGICSWDETAKKTVSNLDELSQSAGDVSSLGDMLRSAWIGEAGGGLPSSERPEELRRGQVRSFKVTKLDPKNRSIRLALS